MDPEELEALTRDVKSAAFASGAALAGVVATENLPEHAHEIERLLPGALAVVVLAVPHSVSALRSRVNEAAQYDTMHTYDECRRSAGVAARFLEAKGFGAVAVPAFIPLDMGDAKKGMRGEICWRRAGVRAGLGVYGDNGLLVTKDYGCAVRLVGVVTAAPLKSDPPCVNDYCDHCGLCISSCPANALTGEGRVDKKLCGDNIFKYGFRYFRGVMRTALGEGEGGVPSERDLRELWQTLMTGNYYYCFSCQSRCPR